MCYAMIDYFTLSFPLFTGSLKEVIFYVLWSCYFKPSWQCS